MFYNYFLSKGEPWFFFTGIAPSSFGGAFTSPLIVSMTGLLSALVDNVIVFVNFPILLVAYLTPIVPSSPGCQVADPSDFLHVGTVQPQLPFALFIIKGSVPVLLNLNSLCPSELCSIMP